MEGGSERSYLVAGSGISDDGNIVGQVTVSATASVYGKSCGNFESYLLHRFTTQMTWKNKRNFSETRAALFPTNWALPRYFCSDYKELKNIITLTNFNAQFFIQ
jgi:hypothetical protein